MILALIFLTGFAFGFWRAHRRKGDLWDKLRYGLAHGLAVTLAVFAVLAMMDFTGTTPF